MHIDLTTNFGQLVATGFVMVLALWAGVWALLSLNARQFSERLKEKFAEQTLAIGENKRATETGIGSLRDQLTSHKTSIDTKMEGLASQTRTLERDLMTLKSELPNHYERRDDAIRREMTIISRLERIAEKMRERTE